MRGQQRLQQPGTAAGQPAHRVPQGAAAGGGDGEEFGVAVAGVAGIHGVTGARPLVPDGAAAATGLGADGPAEPVLRVVRRAVDVEAFQEAQPDRLFQVGGFGPGRVRLGGGFRGEQRTEGGDQVMRHTHNDTAAPGPVARSGRKSP